MTLEQTVRSNLEREIAATKDLIGVEVSEVNKIHAEFERLADALGRTKGRIRKLQERGGRLIDSLEARKAE